MRKLILATEGFPYGKGEKTFILPELERLRQYFDITILSHADPVQMREGMTEYLPENVRLVCFGRPQLSAFDKVRALLLFFLDQEGRMEIREIIRGKTNKRERFYQSLSFYAQALADQKKLRRSGILTAKEPMICYSFWYTYFCYSMVREKYRNPGIHIVTRAHGIDLYHERVPGCRQPFRYQMEKRLDAILFACAYGENYYRTNVKRAEIEKDKLHVCKLGIEPAARLMPVGDGEVWELLSCSNAIPLKRIPLIIDGLARIEDIRIHWTHIGDGSALKDIRKYAEKQLGDRSNITYTLAGFVKNVHAYYEQNQVDCFITTSATEGGCPVSIQEAMSSGVPVIGTDVGGITEMIDDNGILLSRNPDADEVAGAIRKMAVLESSDLKKMKEAAYRKWQAEFDIEVSFKNILNLLESL